MPIIINTMVSIISTMVSIINTMVSVTPDLLPLQRAAKAQEIKKDTKTRHTHILWCSILPFCTYSEVFFLWCFTFSKALAIMLPITVDPDAIVAMFRRSCHFIGWFNG